MTTEAQPISKEVLSGFKFESILDQDPRTRTASLLGSFPATSERAILLLEKTHFTDSFYADVEASFEKLASLGENDVYTWLLGWQSGAEAGVKMTLIRPAGEAHIAKYRAQHKQMVYETPKMYEEVVKPWTESQPSSRIQWVYNILDKKKEADTIIYEDPDPKAGFILLPDLKWDRTTLSSLYLVAIVHDRTLRSLRDLRPEAEAPAHTQLLRNVKQAAEKVAAERYGLKSGGLRCFVHYQPTYYHLHIHILAADYTSHPGALVGQAHLLDDIVDLLSLGVDFRQRTLGYALGDQSELLALLKSKGAV